jgi:putative ABC transport system ATP-binding protein
MTALENVAVPLELAGTRDAFTQAAARLAEVGLSARAEHYPGQLSGGEQQRVALARALSNLPSLLLADEPTGNLDQDTGREIIELLFRVQRERGMTLLLITHEPPLAARCDRQLHMADGRLFEPAQAGPQRQPLAAGGHA